MAVLLGLCLLLQDRPRLHFSLRRLPPSISLEIEEGTRVRLLIIIRYLLVIRVAITTGGKVVEVKSGRLLLLFLRQSLRFRSVALITTPITDVEVGDVLEDIEVLVHFEFLSGIYFFRLRNIVVVLLTFNLL